MNPLVKLQLCFAALARRVNNIDPGDLYLRPSAGDVTVSSDMDSFLQTANDAAARTALGLGTGDSPTFEALSVTGIIGKGFYGVQADSGGVSYFDSQGEFRIRNASTDYSQRISIAISGALTLGASGASVTLEPSANTLYQRNGTAAQTFLLANTYTDDSNYERAIFGFASNVLRIGTENAGGAARAVDMVMGGTAVARLDTSARLQMLNHIVFGTDNTHDIGASGANRPRNLYVGSNIIAGATGEIQWDGSTKFRNASDGVLTLANQAFTDFGRINFGGTTSSFPALKRSTTSLQARLADDSAFTNIQGKLTADTNAVAETPTATHTITIYDATGTAYRVLALV